MKSNNVISQLIIKGDSEHSIEDAVYNIGPESKYIRGLYRSNNNNFDEYYLLGTDTISTYQTEEREIDGIPTVVNVEEIKFCRENDASNYYVLKKEKQIEKNKNIELVSDSDVLTFQFNNEDDMQYISESQSIKQINDVIDIYVKDEDINIIGDIQHENQFLFFVENEGTVVQVLQKEIISSTRKIDGIIKTFTTESISDPN